MKKVLLISETQIKELSLIQMNVEAKVLSRTILDTQSIYLRPILGNELFTRLLNEVYEAATSNTPLATETQVLLNEYIHPYLAHAVVSDLIINLHYRITNKGMLRLNDSSASSINQDEVEYAKNYHDNRTNSFKAELVRYLEEKNMVSCKKDADITTDSIGWYL